ncbi:condensation domain-containing protein [Massilia sp. H-1]|nr:condensation domain-containing protein [Massilia sp. H-1]
MARLSGQDDVVTGTPVANRQRSETEALIGFFVNTMALRVKLGADPTVAELLAQVKAGALAAYSHQDLPFDQVVDAVKAPRTLGHNPLFQVMLALGNTAVAPRSPCPAWSWPASPTVPRARNSTWRWTWWTRHGSIAKHPDLRQRLVRRRHGAPLHRYFETILAGMAKDTQQSVSCLPMLGAAECAQLVSGFNPAPRARAPGLLAHQLFEQQAALRAQDVALEFGERRLTYQELNRRANGLAQQLRALGVGPDARVAICLERGVEMVVCLLAVLKAAAPMCRWTRPIRPRAWPTCSTTARRWSC